MLVKEGTAQVYDFLDNKVPGAEPRDAGYWRDVGTLDSYFDAQHGPVRGAPGVQPVQRPVADPDPRAVAAARQVRARQRRPGRPRDQQRGQQRRDRVRRPGPRTRCCRPASGSTAGRGWSGRWCWTTPGSAGTRWSRTRSWTRTSTCPRAPSSAWTRSTTRRAGSWCPSGGITVVGKGQAGRAMTDGQRGPPASGGSHADPGVPARGLRRGRRARRVPGQGARQAGRPHRALPGRRPRGRGRAPALGRSSPPRTARCRPSPPTCP